MKTEEKFNIFKDNIYISGKTEIRSTARHLYLVWGFPYYLRTVG